MGLLGVAERGSAALRDPASPASAQRAMSDGRGDAPLGRAALDVPRRMQRCPPGAIFCRGDAAMPRSSRRSRPPRRSGRRTRMWRLVRSRPIRPLAADLSARGRFVRSRPIRPLAADSSARGRFVLVRPLWSAFARSRPISCRQPRVDWRRGSDADRTHFLIAVHRTQTPCLAKPSASQPFARGR